MIPAISQSLAWLEENPEVILGIGRGIEREALRIQPDGALAVTSHPAILGSAFTHSWITTDFAESLLEFITPVDHDSKHMLAVLRDIHRYVARNLGDEKLWPLSMPCNTATTGEINIAQYGTSNEGRMKTLYREGLHNRYGSLMQIISGVHYNFSLPLLFWQKRAGITDSVSGKDAISSGYMHLIRNYYRFGWIIPYLFGASPGISSDFLQSKPGHLPFMQAFPGELYLPWATSLRLSDLGYTNKSQNDLDISFNSLPSYIEGIKRALKTPSEAFSLLGVKNDQGEWLQLNTNILQIENELYAPVRPKRVVKPGETPSDALHRAGVEYIEVRSLDVNPFSPIGLEESQICFLDVFLIWCALADSPDLSATELSYSKENWNKVATEGRRPDLQLTTGNGTHNHLLKDIGKALFVDLSRIAKVLDQVQGRDDNQKACEQLVSWFDNPQQTYSAKILQNIMEQGMEKTGAALAETYQKLLSEEGFQILTDDQFRQEALHSCEKQREIEESDTVSFDEFLSGLTEAKGECVSHGQRQKNR